MAASRSVANSFFVLDIGGVNQGYLKKVSGGGYTVDVHESKVSHDLITKKMGSNHKVGEFSCDIGIAMGKGLYTWIKQSFDKAHTYTDGAISIADANYNEVRRINFAQALITEFGTPKLAGDSKEAGYLTVKFQPESIRFAAGGGSKIDAALGDKQKLWMAHNFRLDISGRDCSTIQSVDAFSWKQKTVVNQYGHLKENELIPTGLESGDLGFTLGSGEGGKVENAWMEWAHNWIINGAQTEKDHMTGTLTFLAQDMKTELGSISFEGLGLKEIKPPDLERGDKARSLTVKLYCEHALWNPVQTNA